MHRDATTERWERTIRLYGRESLTATRIFFFFVLFFILFYPIFFFFFYFPSGVPPDIASLDRHRPLFLTHPVRHVLASNPDTDEGEARGT